VGLAFLIVIVVAGVNALGTRDDGSLGIESRAGEPVPQFAVPDAESSLEGDANVFQDDCASARLPCPGGDRRRPACEVPGRRVIRICDYFDRPLVISFWFTRGGDCESEQDVVDRSARRYGHRVGFLSLNVRDDRGTVRRIVRDRHWTVPVGHDRDGAVSNLLRVGGCPTFLYVLPGGIIYSSSIGELGEGELAKRVDRLRRESKRVADAR